MKSKINKKRKQDIIVILSMAFLLFGISFSCFLKKDNDFSESERRILKQFPKVSVETIVSGTFMEEFEAYCLDQFPARDKFRSLKALTKYGLFFQKDNNRIYYSKGHLSKMEYPMNLVMLDYAAEKMDYIYETYLKEQGSKCYMAIVPDKNLFLAKENGYLSMDYETLFSYMENQITYADFIDLSPYLDISDYYRTDTHWKQESIVDVAEAIKMSMGDDKELSATQEEIEKRTKEAFKQYRIETLETPFKGVYYGQAALPVKPDTLHYLNSEILETCKVTSYDTGKPVETVIYNMDKATGKDAYEIFLSGTSALQVIENPCVSNGKELIVFRDSFGSSLIPLLVDDYWKITVIDIRYVQSNVLGNFVDFQGQDTLFLYSTVVLNNSMSLR